MSRWAEQGPEKAVACGASLLGLEPKEEQIIIIISIVERYDCKVENSGTSSILCNTLGGTELLFVTHGSAHHALYSIACTVWSSATHLFVRKLYGELNVLCLRSGLTYL